MREEKRTELIGTIANAMIVAREEDRRKRAEGWLHLAERAGLLPDLEFDPDWAGSNVTALLKGVLDDSYTEQAIRKFGFSESAKDQLSASEIEQLLQHTEKNEDPKIRVLALSLLKANRYRLSAEQLNRVLRVTKNAATDASSDVRDYVWGVFEGVNLTRRQIQRIVDANHMSAYGILTPNHLVQAPECIEQVLWVCETQERVKDRWLTLIQQAIEFLEDTSPINHLRERIFTIAVEARSSMDRSAAYRLFEMIPGELSDSDADRMIARFQKPEALLDELIIARRLALSSSGRET